MNFDYKKHYTDGDIYNISFWGGIIWMFVIASFVYLGGFFVTMSIVDSSFTKDIATMITDGVTTARLMASLFLIELNSKLLPIAILGYVFRKSLIKDLKDFKNNFLRYILLIIASMFLFIILSNIVVQVYKLLGIEGQSANQEIIEQALNSPVRPLGFITVVFLAPILEELIFRKALFGVVEKKFNWSKTTAVIISTIVFSAIHVMSVENFKFIFQYIPLAFIISYSYAHTENIYLPIGIHFINNLISFLLI